MTNFRRNMKINKAFTLAEFLITIGVIGVTAALVIPTLIETQKNKMWNTSAKVFEKKVGETLKIMNSQGVLGGYISTEDFVEEFSKHIKITKTCTNDNLAECFPENIMGTKSVIDVANTSTWENENNYTSNINISDIKTAKDIGQKKWTTNVMGLQLVNGVTALIAYNNRDCEQNPYSNQIDGTKCIALVYDVSGFEKPNTYSKDLRLLNANIGDVACAFKIDGACVTKVFKPTALSPEEGLALVGSEYGVKVAGVTGGDYWAGAVKECGGTKHLPTTEQLAKIASYIYGTEIGASDSVSGLNGDLAKVEKLDYMILGNKFPFSIWGNNSDHINGADERQYTATSTALHFNNRTRYMHGICVDN